MDDLYDNLDNYNEEHTIAELQTENKELKSKLEEYAVTLTNLQKEFDKLSLEYKQLELNYSSLLKTAKAEVERKTQIITNLNLEKDRMVLKSYQNKNAGAMYKSREYDNRMKQNYKKDKLEKPKQDDELKHFEGRKSSPYSTSERKLQDEPSPRDHSSRTEERTASPHSDLRSKLLNLAHRGQQYDPRTEKHSEVKENIMQPKNDSDAFKARASIKDRKKSMPAICIETEQFSDDDDFLANVATKTVQQTDSEHNFSEKHRNIDNFHERPRSRLSESSSLEEKKSGYQEPISDSHKPRSSRYDRGKDSDKYRVRHKSSHRHKRQSPDRYQSGSREYHDPYLRFEHDRYRTKGKTPKSPPRDKFHQRPSREQHRTNYERNHSFEHERLLPRSQERYPMKRRIEHSYDELENKRGRIEPQSRQTEDRRMELDTKKLKMDSHCWHLEDDRRMKDERKLTDKKFVADPLDIQFSSCESPDYDCPDVSNQQTKEIKLTATTKLDDPRISNKKYVLEKNNGQAVLSATIGRNVDIVPIRKIDWGITPVSMPDALVKRPSEPKKSASNVCMKVENPNISIESGEITDVEHIYNENHPQERNKPRDPSSEKTELPIAKSVDSKDIHNLLKRFSCYKIPKLEKSVDDKQSYKHSKEITTVKPVQDNSNTKSDHNPDMAIKNTNVNAQQVKPVKRKKETESHKQDNLVVQSNNQLPSLSSSTIYEKKYSTAKEVVEGDLEMSDDNEQSDLVTKGPVIIKELENKTVDTDKSCNINTEKQSTNASERVTLEPCKDKMSAGDGKKSKTKKKSKHKETKDLSKNEDSAKVFEKPAKKKEKGTKSSHIKTKFSELFDDSSSLISPEDLGLAAMLASTTRLSDKSVPFFEDAVDAADINTMKSNAIKSDAKKESTPPEKTNVEDNMHVTVSKIDTANTIRQENSFEKSDERSNDAQTEMTDEVIKSIYQNLEPGVLEQEDTVVKTVIISTGVQPPVLLEEEKQLLPIKPGPQIKTILDVGLKALATSTPLKILQPDVVLADIEKIPDSGSNSNNNSQIASVENSMVMEQSNSTTMDSQTNEANVPDVRIFVKRRRKVIKK